MGGSLDRYATADMIPSVGKQRGVVSRHDHISGEGGKGLKQTHLMAQIDGLCRSLSDIHTVTHRQGDGQQEVWDKLYFILSLIQSVASLSLT